MNARAGSANWTSRLAAVGEFTAMVIHEVNQPLCAILANASAGQMLLDSKDPPLDEIRDILADIRTCGMRANETVLRMRALLGRREIHLHPIDLDATIAEVLRLVAADSLRRDVRIHSELATALPLVSGDSIHLQQVLLNLVVNAMDAMRDIPETDRTLVVSTRRDGEWAEVTVEDCGHGIAPGQFSSLFRSFFTTKRDGMGLGLSIARSIVEAHGGRIWAENRPAGGAAFHFTVKVAA